MGRRPFATRVPRVVRVAREGKGLRTTGSNGGPLLQGGAPEPRGWLSQWGERHSQLFDPLAGRLLRSPLLV